jgi:hypothetical protein
MPTNCGELSEDVLIRQEACPTSTPTLHLQRWGGKRYEISPEAKLVEAFFQKNVANTFSQKGIRTAGSSQLLNCPVRLFMNLKI